MHRPTGQKVEGQGHMVTKTARSHGCWWPWPVFRTSMLPAAIASVSLHVDSTAHVFLLHLFSGTGSFASSSGAHCKAYKEIVDDCFKTGSSAGVSGQSWCIADWSVYDSLWNVHDVPLMSLKQPQISMPISRQSDEPKMWSQMICAVFSGFYCCMSEFGHTNIGFHCLPRSHISHGK